jgi:hypothetical protein
MRRSASFLLVGAVAGCGPKVGVPDGADDGSTTGTASDPTDPSAGPTADPSATPTSVDPDDGDGDAEVESGVPDDGGSIVVVDDFGGGPITGCSIWERDCPPGMKCMPYANDGGASWNATICTPIARDPQGIGDPCDGSQTLEGVDDCDIHMMCWDVDPDTDEGECVGFCIGNEVEFSCADPNATCHVPAEGVLALCLPNCHPLDEPCDEGDLCVPSNDTFVCAPDASGEGGAAGDPCEFINVCDPGLFCANAESVPGCADIGCCAAFCDLTAGDPCPGAAEGVECVAWFEEGSAPAGYEALGACVVPS